MIVVIPLYCVAVLMAFLAARVGTTAIYGQGTGVYDHYFYTFLNPTDLIWSFFQVVAMAVVIMLVHTYYGFTASRRAGRGRRGRGPGSAHLDDRRGVRDRDDLAGRLRPVRQLQPVRLAHGPSRGRRLHPAWWTLILFGVLSPLFWLTSALFTGTFKSYVPVTVTSDRSGMVMETSAKVKMRGVQVGRVSAIAGGQRPAPA